MSIDLTYGTDVSTFFGDGPEGPDLDPNFGIISGPRVIAEAVLRRWSQQRFELIEDENAGEDIRWILKSKMDDTRRILKQQALEAEAEKDERVASCSVLFLRDASGEAWTIKGVIYPKVGEAFSVVVDPELLTLEVLKGIR